MDWTQNYISLLGPKLHQRGWYPTAFIGVNLNGLNWLPLLVPSPIWRARIGEINIRLRGIFHSPIKYFDINMVEEGDEEFKTTYTIEMYPCFGVHFMEDPLEGALLTGPGATQLFCSLEGKLEWRERQLWYEEEQYIFTIIPCHQNRRTPLPQQLTYADRHNFNIPFPLVSAPSLSHLFTLFSSSIRSVGTAMSYFYCQ